MRKLMFSLLGCWVVSLSLSIFGSALWRAAMQNWRMSTRNLSKYCRCGIHSNKPGRNRCASPLRKVNIIYTRICLFLRRHLQCVLVVRTRNSCAYMPGSVSGHYTVSRTRLN